MADWRTISPFVEKCFDELALPPRALILDMPCGFGRHALWLAARGHRIVAADIDTQRVFTTVAAHSKSTRSARVDCLVADCETDLPFQDAVFDAALVVHYYSELIVEKVTHAIKPRGHLIFETFGAHGQNWRSLPPMGAVAKSLNRAFEIVHLKERPAGPSRENAVVRTLAKKRE